MTKGELINYIIGDVKMELENTFPDSFSHEMQMLDYAQDLVNKKFDHIRQRMFEAYAVERKT